MTLDEQDRVLIERSIRDLNDLLVLLYTEPDPGKQLAANYEDIMAARKKLETVIHRAQVQRRYTREVVG